MQRPKFMLGVLAAALLGAAAGVRPCGHLPLRRRVRQGAFHQHAERQPLQAVHGHQEGAGAVTTTLNSRFRPYPTADRKRYHAHILAAARVYPLEPALLHAVISAESGYNPLARSAKGANGLMQLMPDTARRYGVDNPLDPEQNI